MKCVKLMRALSRTKALARSFCCSTKQTGLTRLAGFERENRRVSLGDPEKPVRGAIDQAKRKTRPKPGLSLFTFLDLPTFTRVRGPCSLRERDHVHEAWRRQRERSADHLH